MKMIDKRSCSLGLASLALALTACRAPQGGAANVYTFSEGAHETIAAESNRTLAAQVRVQGARTLRPEPGERLRAQCQLQNHSPRKLRFEYSVDWFDAAGVLVGSSGTWTPTVLTGGALVSVSLTAPTPAVNTWKLQVRPQNEVF